jgi:hypothetical protein
MIYGELRGLLAFLQLNYRMKDYNPVDSFTYCWTDHKTKMLYVGIHKGSYDDGYVCSSRLMIEEYNKRPNDFTRQILAHGTYKEMCKFETSILRAENAGKNPNYYNKHTNNGQYVILKHTEETKRKIGDANRGPNLKARGPRPNFTGKNNHFFGKTHSEEFKIRQSKNKKKTYTGSGNPKAMTLQINDKIYYTMKEASTDLDISNYLIRKMLKSGEARRLK